MPSFLHKKSKENEKRIQTFIAALKNRDYSQMKELIDKGFDINHIWFNDFFKTQVSALHLAVLEEDMELVSWLIANKADLNLEATSLKTPLYFAVKKNNTAMAKLLLDNGANLIAKSMAMAVRKENLDMFCLLLNENDNRIELKNYFDYRKLFTLILNAPKEVVAELLNQKLDFNIKVWNDKYNQNLSLLQSAIFEKETKVVELLLKFKVNFDGETTLNFAIKNNLLNMVKLLVEQGADVNLGKDEYLTPLMVAVSHRSTEIVKYLLQNGANVNALSGDKTSTPLILAASEGFKKITSLLLEHGALVDITNDEGQTALLMAVENGHEYIMNILLAHHANINHRNHAGNSALHLALDDYHDHSYSMVKTLLINGANVNVLDGDGHSPLYQAMSTDDSDLKFSLALLSNGAKLDHHFCDEVFYKFKHHQISRNQFFSGAKLDRQGCDQVFHKFKHHQASANLFFYETLIQKDIVLLEKILKFYDYKPELSGLTVYLSQRQLAPHQIEEAINFLDTMINGKILEPELANEFKNILKTIGLKQEQNPNGQKEIAPEIEAGLKNEIVSLKKQVATLTEQNAMILNRLDQIIKVSKNDDEKNKTEKTKSNIAYSPRLL